MDWRQFNSAIATSMNLQRAWRCCLLITLRELRRSVLHGRPMSLPNLLRLFRRRWGDAGKISVPSDCIAEAMSLRGSWLLEHLYRSEQPFATTVWSDLRCWLRSADESCALEILS